MISFELASLHRLERIFKNLLDVAYRDENGDERILITLNVHDTGVYRIEDDDLPPSNDDDLSPSNDDDLSPSNDDEEKRNEDEIPVVSITDDETRSNDNCSYTNRDSRYIDDETVTQSSSRDESKIKFEEHLGHDESSSISSLPISLRRLSIEGKKENVSRILEKGKKSISARNVSNLRRREGGRCGRNDVELDDFNFDKGVGDECGNERDRGNDHYPDVSSHCSRDECGTDTLPYDGRDSNPTLTSRPFESKLSSSVSPQHSRSFNVRTIVLEKKNEETSAGKTKTSTRVEDCRVNANSSSQRHGLADVVETLSFFSRDETLPSPKTKLSKRTIVSLRTRCFSMTIESSREPCNALSRKKELYRRLMTSDEWLSSKIKEYRTIVRQIRKSFDIALREQYEIFSRIQVAVNYMTDSYWVEEENNVGAAKETNSESVDRDTDRTLAFLSLFIDCVLLFVAFPLTYTDIDVNFLISSNFIDVLIAQNEEEFEIALKLDASNYMRNLKSDSEKITTIRKRSSSDPIVSPLESNEVKGLAEKDAANDEDSDPYGRINFVIRDNNIILNVDSREPRRRVTIEELRYPEETVDRFGKNRNGFFHSGSKKTVERNYAKIASLDQWSRSLFDRKRTSTTTFSGPKKIARIVDERSARDANVDFNATSVVNRTIPAAASLRHSLSKEQLEIIRLYENVRTRNDARKDSTRRCAPRIFRRFEDDSSSLSSDKRLIVDGVAGAGKTFVLGYFLERFKVVQYLVKKRMFVQNVKNRFADAQNLRTSTIDSFLMKTLGVKDLQVWLDMLKTSMDGLREEASRCALRNVKDTLYFIDEFGQIEGTLALLLNILLRDCNVILVGDTNQQSAINENANCPVRTLLGYRHIAFMYENTRAKDVNLLRRLSQFYFKRKDERVTERILDGLPTSNLIDLRPFLDSLRRDDYDYSLLPKVIVTSNEQTNYVNWAIGKIMWIHARANKKLRYTRKIVRSAKPISIFSDFKTNDETAAKRDGEIYGVVTRCESNDRGMRERTSGDIDRENVYETEELYDDPYADEHFVLVGMCYRIIFNHPSYPFEVGSRVVVTRIESENVVWATRAETYRPSDDAINSTSSLDDVATRVEKLRVKPYEFKSAWHSLPDVDIYMFPFVSDQATTIYQIQGITLSERECSRCYIDADKMDERALYVALSRFESERQIIGVINTRL